MSGVLHQLGSTVKGMLCEVPCICKVPWFAAAVWAVCAVGTGLGLWLLFSDSPAGYTPNLANLGASLPLVMSTLWLLAHISATSPALFFAAGMRRHQLALVADCAEALCWVLGLTAAVAAIGLGHNDDASAFPRYGFVQSQGVAIADLPAEV